MSVSRSREIRPLCLKRQRRRGKAARSGLKKRSKIRSFSNFSTSRTNTPNQNSKKLSSSILLDFLLELGDDFAFLGRQRRLRLDDTWFRIDLIFFHRRLRCLLIIDLKVGKFGYADAGQMHLYLNYAREHWMKTGENPPVGLILCTEKGVAEAHYALDNLPNKVLAAEYKTVLPDEKLIAQELERSQAQLQERQVKFRLE